MRLQPVFFADVEWTSREQSVYGEGSARVGLTAKYLPRHRARGNSGPRSANWRDAAEITVVQTMA